LPGLAPLRANARRYSLAVLLLYLGVLSILTFGHRCITPVPELAAAQSASTSHAVHTAHSELPATDNYCFACNWLRATTSTVPATASPVLTLIRVRPDLPVLRYHSLPGVVASPTSRGPPLS
jgi:hypothetical protein